MTDYNSVIQDLVKSCLIIDIETSAHDESGNPIDIRKQFDKYVQHAVVKWVGMYSYKYDNYIEVPVAGNEELIRKFIDEHAAYVGFNNNQFDCPILYNNGLMGEYQNNIDVMEILGTNKFLGHKMRSNYMKIKLSPITIDGKTFGANSLNGMAHAFGLDVVKGDIDYRLFEQNDWSEEEKNEIKKYLRSDLVVTRKLFDRLVDFWRVIPEMGWLYEEDVINWSWLRSSIASLTYKSACKIKGVQPTYGNKGESEEMGGRAIEPKYEEVYGVHYIDEVSKYPHTFAEFDLFSEVDVSGMTEEEKSQYWHGNEMFQVKGYYNITQQSALSKDVLEKLRKRFSIQAILKTSTDMDETQKAYLEGQVYMIKIFLNALYGAVRSSIFEQIYSPNAGWDCCWIGQQIHEYVEKRLIDYGFECVGGFTDSWFVKDTQPEARSQEELMVIADSIMNELKPYMPYPSDTHKIGYECYMDYVMFHANEEDKYKKNNYCYISSGKVKVVGFPIKKSNATLLGRKMYKEVLEPKILADNRAKFDSEWLKEQVMNYLNISDMVISYDCKPSSEYKPRTDKDGNEIPSSNIYAQVSRAYTDGLGGVVGLIKNRKAGQIGNAVQRLAEGKKLGKTHWFYGTLQECIDAGVQKSDVDLNKIYNELAPFCVGGKLE